MIWNLLEFKGTESNSRPSVWCEQFSGCYFSVLWNLKLETTQHKSYRDFNHLENKFQDNLSINFPFISSHLIPQQWKSIKNNFIAADPQISQALSRLKSSQFFSLLVKCKKNIKIKNFLHTINTINFSSSDKVTRQPFLIYFLSSLAILSKLSSCLMSCWLNVLLAFATALLPWLCHDEHPKLPINWA